MISYDKKCIFVHIPKTGGSSIENLIWTGNRRESDLWKGHITPYYNKYQTGGLQHLFATHIQQEVGNDVFKSFFKFSFVRNPWDKAVSQFCYMKTIKILREFIGMSKDDCFKQYLSLIQTKKHVQWEEQYKFILDQNGNSLVDFIGRFENFENDVRYVLQTLNNQTSLNPQELTPESAKISFAKIPHVKQSLRTHYTDYYDNESKDIVRHLYQKDIELFNYIF
ncbi:MAG: sulfotransferase family protein [Symploca sp. SIO1B1]|nr:sulfotransferase family protein [Symploca sp. SIO1C2]NER94573.1 sulfotransferase family protein [Symploca sp. SIO1B1]